MVIVKPSDEHDEFYQYKKRIREVCICPCCKSTNTYSIFTTSHYTGMMGGGPIMETTRFGCETCGAQWESDPYFMTREDFHKYHGTVKESKIIQKLQKGKKEIL